ncbi:BMP family ABC transporter substrate-binding protein [Halalkalibacterium halodurans]|uniref:ABC transporter substrate-binding protein PnrA-like domain-containing protein n=1 Tax=Halalkalibacterium halodurans TaxID=86665 RepID=A0A0M0KLE8_ALKHA|nr:BMP family ABC transporter substrate-binding protein [Halalkalibacterium halodurans]MDY7222361.1 BMP family ABC transporter substrate-binding protein [Halalkalibacterium halodurans]MDY7241582.1 BMP family ABC transporter substrate-binding protein [Halalkalibacterium halodurans]MED3646363.1 BMP family ABC transporter substrate-binding protein [Halalkalibacterium halodurans]MED4082332.1 BMP family ABC transporter substrate-binding protein [Halalkalibacterium halodurans]MED4083517.1 BMP family
MQQSRQRLWMLVATLIVVAIILMILCYQSVKIVLSPDTEPTDRVIMSIFTSDKLVDQSWGSLAYLAQLHVEKKFPVDIELYSEVDTIEKMEESLHASIDRKTELIIGHGREFSDFFTKVAPSYPTVRFVTIHGSATYENQTVYTFEKGKIELIAALAATMKSKTRKVALIDAYDGREDEPYFERGLEKYANDIEFFYYVVNSRHDGKQAKAVMDKLIKEGVDVVYSRGNAFNRDVIHYAKQHDIYVIGFLDDQSYLGEEHVLTSVLNDVTQAYVKIIEDYFNEEEPFPNGIVILSGKDGVFRLAPFGKMFTEEEKKRLQEELDRYYRGEL